MTEDQDDKSTTTWGRLISLAYERPVVAVALSFVFAVTLVLVPVVMAWPQPDCSACESDAPECDCHALIQQSASCESRAELLGRYADECKLESDQAEDALIACLAGKVLESISAEDLLNGN
jgi:hypothetical protein